MKKLKLSYLLFFCFFLLPILNADLKAQPTWHVQNSSPGNYFWSASFPKSDTGYAVGNNGIVMRTSNGGNFWVSSSSGNSTLLHHTFFISAQIGWVVGSSGVIRHTSNAGLNWVPQTSGTSENLFYVHFINRNIGWVAGDNGVLKTTDRGVTWAPQLIEQWVYSVFFVNENTGWAGVRFGKMFKTTNGGSTWAQQNTDTLSTFFSMYFIDQNVGYAVGDYNCILKTTNGGSVWTPQTYSQGGIGTTMRSVHFVDQQKGWIAGLNGLLLRTTNGGTNWTRQSAPANVDYLAIRIKDGQGWAVGGNGTIIHSNTLTNVGIVSNEMPGKLSLDQNYPNPFNPVTKIKFQIPAHVPELNDVSLTVYDITGKEVQVLLNGVNTPGFYEAEFDGSVLSSGVYFYTLKVSGFIDTKKMLLIK